MTRGELGEKIADRIEEEFAAGKRRGNGTVRPHLERQDCETIADLIWSTVAQADLGIFDVDTPTKKP